MKRMRVEADGDYLLENRKLSNITLQACGWVVRQCVGRVSPNLSIPLAIHPTFLLLSSSFLCSCFPDIVDSVCVQASCWLSPRDVVYCWAYCGLRVTTVRTSSIAGCAVLYAVRRRIAFMRSVATPVNTLLRRIPPPVIWRGLARVKLIDETFSPAHDVTFAFPLLHSFDD